MAGAGHQRRPGVGADRRRGPPGDGGVAVVVRAGHHQHRHVDRPAARPTAGAARPVPASSRLVARPSAVLRRRSSSNRRLGRQPGEHRHGQPPVDERGHALVPDAPGRGQVGRPAFGPLGGVLDAGRAAHEHQAPAPPRGPRWPRAGPCGRPSSSRGRRRGRPPRPPAARSSGRSAAHAARAAVPGRVEPDHLVVARPAPGRAAPSTGRSGRSRGAARPRGPEPVAFAVERHGEGFLSLPCRPRLPTRRPRPRLARRRAGHLRRHAGRRVGARRPHRRRRVPGVALDAAGPGAGRPRRRAAARAPRRALGRVPGPGPRAGRRPARRRAHHQRHRRRRAAPGGRRGRPGGRAPAGVHRRPAARAARRGRAPGHRPGAPVRPVGALVRRPGRARGRRAPDRWRAFAARAYAATLGAPARPGAPEPALPRAAGGLAGPLPPARADGPWTSVVPALRRPSLRRRGGRVDRAASGRGRRSPAAVACWWRARSPGRRAGAAHRRRRAPTALGLAGGGRAPRRRRGWPAPALVAHVDAVLRSPRAADRAAAGGDRAAGRARARRGSSNEWLAASRCRPTWSWARTGLVRPVGDRGDGHDRPGRLAGVARAAARPADAGAPDRRAVVAATAGWVRLLRRAGGPGRGAPPPVGPVGPVARRPVNEPGVARAVVRALPAGAHLVVSSSMPIRDVERYARAHGPGVAAGGDRARQPGRQRHRRRGVHRASGVAAGTGGAHRAAHRRRGVPPRQQRPAGRRRAAAVDLVCVVVDNDGGGIFSFLPQARALAADRFEALFGTPHGLDLVALAVGLRRRRPAAGAGRRRGAGGRRAAAEGGVHVLVVATDRAANVEVHRRVDEAVAAAVEPRGGARRPGTSGVQGRSDGPTAAPGT